MDTCLYCAVDQRDSPLSDEHIIPSVLGGWLKYRCACKSHNEQLGSDLESKLKENAFVACALHSLGLQGLDKAYRHGRVTIHTSDGKELRGTIEGAQPRIIPQDTATEGLVVPEETTKKTLRTLIARFETKNKVPITWHDNDYDSIPYGQPCRIPGTNISFIKRKSGSGFARIDGLNCPLPFRMPAKMALTHLAALGCPVVQWPSFAPLKTWILHGGDNQFALIGPPIDELDPSDLDYKPYHYIKYRFVDPHLLALVTLFGAIRFGVYLAEVPELSQWLHLSALDQYHVYDIREREVFPSDCPNDLREDHITLLDAVLEWHRAPRLS